MASFLARRHGAFVQIYGDYKEATVALLTQEDVFGELSFQETSRQNAFAEAVTESRVAVVRSLSSTRS